MAIISIRPPASIAMKPTISTRPAASISRRPIAPMWPSTPDRGDRVGAHWLPGPHRGEADRARRHRAPPRGEADHREVVRRVTSGHADRREGGPALRFGPTRSCATDGEGHLGPFERRAGDARRLIEVVPTTPIRRRGPPQSERHHPRSTPWATSRRSRGARPTPWAGSRWSASSPIGPARRIDDRGSARPDLPGRSAGWRSARPDPACHLGAIGEARRWPAGSVPARRCRARMAPGSPGMNADAPRPTRGANRR